MQRLLVIYLLVVVTASTTFGSTYSPALTTFEVHGSVEKFIRTELYFGRNIPQVGNVTEEDWQRFLDDVVTPRFPDGLTVLDADGQWRGKGGAIAHEESKVIVLLYPRKQRKQMIVKIEEIRSEYKKRFAQEAVMRIDITRSVEVSF